MDLESQVQTPDKAEFHSSSCSRERHESISFCPSFGQVVGFTGISGFDRVTSLRKEKL